MAGACASLVFPGEATEGALASWEHIVGGRASSRSETSFCILPAPEEISETPLALPFFYGLALRGDARWWLEHEEEASIADAFGFTPELEIMIGATCRGYESDFILGELACALLAEHRGALLFDGLLHPTLDHDAWRRWGEQTEEQQVSRFPGAIGPHPGKLAVTRLEGNAVAHVVDDVFLAFWMEHPAFHFVN